MSIYKLPEDSIENLTFQINPEIRVVTTASNYNLLGSEPLPTLSYVTGAINIVVGNDLRQFDAGSNNSILNLEKFTATENKEYLFINLSEVPLPKDEQYYDSIKNRQLVLIDTGSSGFDNTSLTTILENLLSSAVDQNNKNFKKIQFGVERIDSHTTSSNLFATVSIGTIGTSNKFRDRLLPYYKNIIENIDKNNSPQNLLQLETTSSYDPFVFTNTFCLNLFSSSVNEENNYIIAYPSASFYTPTGSFTFSFDINIREALLEPKAGTLLFVSSSYAISIISGSSKNEEDKSDKFRIMLQIANGTDILPENISTSSTPANCFISDDNVLETNKWHNVSIRWGTNQINNGKGDFLVDGIEAGSLIINSSSFPTIVTSSIHDEPATLFVGCRIISENIKYDQQSYKNIFNLKNSDYGSAPDPIFDNFLEKTSIYLTSSLFNSQVFFNLYPSNFCNFELKNISIYDSFLLGIDFHSSSNKKLFYLPIKFNKNFNILKKQSIIPLQIFSCIEPNIVSTFYSQNFGCQLNNVESFLLEEIQNFYPRVFNLSSHDNTGGTFNAFKYTIKDNAIKTNLIILPIDIKNNFNFNSQDYYLTSKNFVKNQTTYDSLSTINIIYNLENNNELGIEISNFDRNILEEQLNNPQTNQYNLDYEHLININNNYSSSEEQILRMKDNILSLPYIINLINQDNDSALNVVFAISPMLYGNRVLPGSLVLKDTNYLLTGKTMTLKDNGYGGLCRADVEDFSKENIVGRVFYDEGLIIITNPTIYYFGKFGFDITFRGEKNIHVYRVSYSAPMSHLNRSTNNPDVNSDNFSLITGVNFMDENLNVVMKTKLAQPIIKTKNERLDFRTKLDY